MKFRATTIFILLAFVLQAQTVLKVHITDGHQRPLPFAIVKHGTSTATVDKAGALIIHNYTAGSKIEVHKLGFADTSLSLSASQLSNDTTHFTISLRLRATLLPEVSVSSALLEEINPMKAGFIIGYEIKGNYLVELLSNNIVLVMDMNNKIVSRSQPINGAEDIVKDPNGNIHIITATTAHKIDADSAGLRVDTAHVDLVKLKWDLQYCDEATRTTRYIRRYKDNNQTVAFFAMAGSNSNQAKALKIIGNAERSGAVQAYANETNGLLLYLDELEQTDSSAGGVMGDVTWPELELYRKAERMVSFLEKNYVLPSYNVLKLVNDSIYLFAHDIDSMFVYDQRWNLIKGRRISYHHLKSWGKEIIVNEERSRVFAKFFDSSSKPMLAEIDLQSGELKPTSFAINARFPNKIKIKNDVLYFMAKQKSGVGNTIYFQNLQLPH